MSSVTLLLLLQFYSITVSVQPYLPLVMGDEGKVITLAVCREFLVTQERTFTKLVQILTDDIKSEKKLIKTNINDLKVSAQFSYTMIDELKAKVHRIEGHPIIIIIIYLFTVGTTITTKS